MINLCDTIRSFNTFFSSITNLSRIQWFPFFNNLWWRQCAYCGGYTAWPTRCQVSRERSTLRVPLSSFPSPWKRLWNLYLCNNSIGFDNSLCMRKFVVCRGATLYPLYQRSNLGAKVCVLYRIEFQRPLGRFAWRIQILVKIFPVEVWDHLLTYSLDAP